MRYYLFCRQSVAIENDPDKLVTLLEACPARSSVLQFSNKFYDWSAEEFDEAWADADVVSFLDHRSGEEIASDLRHVLSGYEHWALISQWGHVTESLPGGPATLAFEKTGAAKRGFTMLFLRYPEGNDKWQGLAERLQGAIRESCAPFFHARNGKALVVVGVGYDTLRMPLRRHKGGGVDIAGIDRDNGAFFNDDWEAAIWYGASHLTGVVA